ncbi:MAG TPA: hypothetical protein VGE93_14010, partial [Bryobacteraceae bacterium]
MVLLSEPFYEVAGVDRHGTFEGTETVYRAGIETIVLIVLQDTLIGLRVAGSLEAGKGAAEDAPLAGREGIFAAGTAMFAVAAFHTFVDLRLDDGQGFQILQMAFLVGVQDDTGIEERMRIDAFFEILHDAVGLFTPFVTDIRGDLA